MTAYNLDVAASVAVNSSVPTQLKAQCAADESFALSAETDVVRVVFEAAAAALILNAAVDSFVESDVNLADQAIVSAQAALVRDLFVLFSDTALLTDSVISDAIINVFMQEQVSLTARLFEDNEQYVVWVANADTLAHSRYAKFNFNSMARLGAHYYGADQDGIHLLEGKHDGIQDIRYFLTLPKTQFGTTKPKRLRQVFIGFRNDWDVFLKVIDGEGMEYVYRFRKTSNGLSRSAASVGRGIKSRYFTFDLYNAEDGDLGLDRVQFFPVEVTRY